MVMKEKCGMKYERLLQLSKDVQFEKIIPPIYPIPKTISSHLDREKSQKLYREVYHVIGEQPWIVRSSENEDNEEVNAGKYMSMVCNAEDDFYDTMKRVSEYALEEGTIDIFVQRLIFEKEAQIKKGFLNSDNAPFLCAEELGTILFYLEGIHRKFPQFSSIDCEWCLRTNMGIVSMTSNTKISAGVVRGEINLGFGLFSAQKSTNHVISGTYIVNGNLSGIWFGNHLVEAAIQEIYLVQVRPVKYQLFYDVAYYAYHDRADIVVPIKNVIIHNFKHTAGKYIAAFSLDEAWKKYEELKDESITYFLVEQGSSLEHAGLMCRHKGISVFVLDAIPELYASYRYCAVNFEENQICFYKDEPQQGEARKFASSTISPKSFFVDENNLAHTAKDCQHRSKNFLAEIPDWLSARIVENTEKNEEIIFSERKERFLLPCGIHTIIDKIQNQDIRAEVKRNLAISHTIEDYILIIMAAHLDLYEDAKEIIRKIDHCLWLKLFYQNLYETIGNKFLSHKEKVSVIRSLLQIILEKKQIEILNDVTIPSDLKVKICNELTDAECKEIINLFQSAAACKKNMFDTAAEFKQFPPSVFGVMNTENQTIHTLTMLCIQLIYYDLIEYIDSYLKTLLKDRIDKQDFSGNLTKNSLRGLKIWANFIDLFDSSLSNMAITWLEDAKNQDIESVDIGLIDYFSEEFMAYDYATFCSYITNAHQIHNLLHQRSLYYFQIKDDPYLNPKIPGNYTQVT